MILLSNSRAQDLKQIWLGLRINKCISVFDSQLTIKLPDLRIITTPQILFENLQEVAITCVVQPIVLANGWTGENLADGILASTIKRFQYLSHWIWSKCAKIVAIISLGIFSVRDTNLHTLLKRTSACSTLEELSQVLRECPKTKFLIVLEDVTANDCCPGCDQQLLPGELLTHLRAANAKIVESLFQSHQKFLFFFEHVAELYIQHCKDNPNDIQNFMNYLLGPDCRLRVSWRFLTVIVRTVLSTHNGTAIIDKLLSSIGCNQLTCYLTPNAQKALSALCSLASTKMPGKTSMTNLM